MTHDPVCPAYALSHVAPAWLEALTPIERFVLPHMPRLWLRPAQILPAHDWRSCGFIRGRGWGKSSACAVHANEGVESGRIKRPAFIGPTEDRVEEVQIDFLIRLAPPWFRPERSRGGIVWPNGVRGEIHSAEAPEHTRSSNFDFVWACELGAWPATTRGEAFNNIATATRDRDAQIVWDSTSNGVNELVLAMVAANRADPLANVLTTGVTFDNPMLLKKYLKALCRIYWPPTSRRYREEVLGQVFAETAGALWTQAAIDAHRRATRPEARTLTIVAIDPALRQNDEADETGIMIGDRGADGEVYVHTDSTGHHSPDAWAKIAIDWCAREAAGVVIETNHVGDLVAHALMSEARTRGMTSEILQRGAKRFPSRRPGHVFIREVHAHLAKTTRALGPAAESEAGRVHVVGDGLRELELELITFEPEPGRKSPNRFDAHAYLVTELAGLAHGQPANASQDAAHAAAAQVALQARLTAAVRGQRVGL